MKERAPQRIHTCNFNELFGVGKGDELDIHQRAAGCSIHIRRAPDLLLVYACKDTGSQEEMVMSATVQTKKEASAADELRIWGADLDTHERSAFAPSVAAYFRAEQFMRYSLGYFDTRGRVTHFDANWIWGTNYDTYHQARNAGGTPWEAAASTWTAHTLAQLGFSPEPIKIEEFTPIDKPQCKARISARFPRIV